MRHGRQDEPHHQGGQISVPAAIRKRWGARPLVIEDHGDSMVVRPADEDPITALRGVLKGRILPSDELRRIAREDEADAEERRSRRYVHPD
jgi:bifunctional DNA-binding transcriptional regulator/antitoxin component of YhaV-PrlF toxin-antitoxin module